MEKALLEIMACPKCKGGIQASRMFLTCKRCGLAYPILEDVPNMLIEEAWPIGKARKASFRHSLRL